MRTVTPGSCAYTVRKFLLRNDISFVATSVAQFFDVFENGEVVIDADGVFLVEDSKCITIPERNRNKSGACFSELTDYSEIIWFDDFIDRNTAIYMFKSPIRIKAEDVETERFHELFNEISLTIQSGFKL